MLRTVRRCLTSPLPVVLIGLALAGLLLSGASILHSHSAGQAGLYNQEHDLTYLATLGGAGLVSEAPSASPLVVVVVLAMSGVAVGGSIPWRRHADFRAPPLS